jgi:hypothetical protein
MNSTKRFDLLKDNSGIKNNNYKNTSNKKPQPLDNNFKTNRFVSKQINEERNKKQKDEKFVKSLDSLTEFPELQIIKKKDKNDSKSDNNKNKPNFIHVINNNNNNKNEEHMINENDKNEESVPPGSVCIKYDRETKKILWGYGAKNNNNDAVSEGQEPYFVFQRLVDLYKTRKYEYIRKWGIEEYDKMFLFQNYDYGYFEKLDEDTEECIKKSYENAYYMNNNYEIYN